MNHSTVKRLPSALSVVIACVALGVLSGCGGIGSAVSSLTQECPSHPIIVDLRVDVSGSTSRLRAPGGLYDNQIRSVLHEAAVNCARVVATPIDGNSSSAQPVLDVTFASKFRGNPAAAEADRTNQVARQLPIVHRLLSDKYVAGSDQLGALARAGHLATQKPPGSIYNVVVISDMALKVGGPHAYSVYGRSLLADSDRRAFIADLNRRGELPDLSAVDGIWFGGVGVGISSRTVARGTLALVPALIRSMHGHTVFAGPNLMFALGDQGAR